MRIPLLATLSGRIVLGFAVLLVTFGTISFVIVFNMGLLSDEIRLIRTGYIPLALEAKNLEEKQEALWSYLYNELQSETNPERVKRLLLGREQDRQRSLVEIEKVLDELTDVPGGHRRNIEITRQAVKQLDVDIDKQTPRYKKLRENPPVAANGDSGGDSGDPAVEQSRALFTQVKMDESEIRSRLRPLVSRQSAQAERIAQTELAAICRAVAGPW